MLFGVWVLTLSINFSTSKPFGESDISINDSQSTPSSSALNRRVNHTGTCSFAEWQIVTGILRRIQQISALAVSGAARKAQDRDAYAEDVFESHFVTLEYQSPLARLRVPVRHRFGHVEHEAYRIAPTISGAAYGETTIACEHAPDALRLCQPRDGEEPALFTLRADSLITLVGACRLIKRLHCLLKLEVPPIPVFNHLQSILDLAHGL